MIRINIRCSGLYKYSRVPRPGWAYRPTLYTCKLFISGGVRRSECERERELKLIWSQAHEQKRIRTHAYIYLYKYSRVPRPGWAYRPRLYTCKLFIGKSETKRMRERELKLIWAQAHEQKRIRIHAIFLLRDLQPHQLPDTTWTANRNARHCSATI